MSKSKSVLLTLRRDRDTPFRRTVTVGKDGSNKQLVFEPGVDLELTEEMAKQVQDLIDSGMVTLADRDAKGRLRVPRQAADSDGVEVEKMQEVIDGLRSTVMEQREKIAALESANAELDALLSTADAT